MLPKEVAPRIFLIIPEPRIPVKDPMIAKKSISKFAFSSIFVIESSGTSVQLSDSRPLSSLPFM